MPLPLRVSYLGLQEYQQIWRAMSTFTDERTDQDDDQLWIVQHPPVFTQGQAGKPDHLLNPGDIPLVQSDRGGQVTYHGPGQIIAYPLLDLRRQQLSVRDLVTVLEKTAVMVLADYGIKADPKADAPGVYVNIGGEDAKIASLGLRVRKGRSFHGMSLNVAMDLEPFRRINPCGYQGLAMTQMQDLLSDQVIDYAAVEQSVVETLANNLNRSIIVDADHRH